jgi:hypothetical protein
VIMSKLHQLRQHKNQWSELPESLNCSLTRFVNGIDLPKKTNGLTNKFLQAQSNFADNIVCIANDHLHSEIGQLVFQLNQFTDFNDEEWLTFLIRANATIRKKLPTCMSPYNIKQLEEDIDRKLDRGACAKGVEMSIEEDDTPSEGVIVSVQEGLAYSSISEVSHVESLPMQEGIRSYSDSNLENLTSIITSDKLYVHDSRHKVEWKIHCHNSTEVLVISDSNLRYARDFPSNWEINVYPGARFRHVLNLLHAFRRPTSLKSVVLAVGVNNREDDLNDVSRCVWHIREQLRHFPNHYFLAVCPNRRWKPREIETVNAINAILNNEAHPSSDYRLTHGKAFITTNFPVYFRSRSPNEVHYDQMTVDRIIHQLMMTLSS